jgi:hypothetical protein
MAKKESPNMDKAQKGKKPKIYLAILNDGWVRSEHINTVLMIHLTPNVELQLENPAVTWGIPITSNRNQIRKRFLETDADFLLMFDDDVIPLFNPAEAVFYDKDILGLPTRRRMRQRLEWVIYAKHPVLENRYAAIDLDKVKTDADLLQVDGIGTGAILIKRKVLEVVKHPFEDLFDDEGIRILGQDLNFCQKAIKAGFGVFVAPKMICEHIKDHGLVNIDGCFVIQAGDKNQERYDISWGGEEIIEKDWDLIEQIITDEKVKTVLEFGSGFSTLLMSQIASVDSFETNPEQIDRVRNRLPRDRKVNLYPWDGETKPDSGRVKKKYDLVFIDGPESASRANQTGRRIPIEIAIEHSDRIILHDAGKMHETMLQEKYLRKDFDLLARNGWHQTRCQYWKRKEGLKSEL